MLPAIVLIALLYPSSELVTNKLEKVESQWQGRTTIGQVYKYPKAKKVVPVKFRLEVKP